MKVTSTTWQSKDPEEILGLMKTYPAVYARFRELTKVDRKYAKADLSKFKRSMLLHKNAKVWHYDNIIITVTPTNIKIDCKA